MYIYTFPVVPDPPVCPKRWQVASLTSVTVNWTAPMRQNGLITAYYIQLISYNDGTMIDSAVDDDLYTLGSTLSGLSLGKFFLFVVLRTLTPNCPFTLMAAVGVPYRVRVFAENGAGNGSFCTITDFGDQARKS